MRSGYKAYTTRPGQSLYDVCLNIYGPLDYLVMLMTDNSISSINLTPAAGQVFAYNPNYIIDQQINQLNNVYATAVSLSAPNDFDDPLNTQDYDEDFNEDFG